MVARRVTEDSSGRKFGGILWCKLWQETAWCGGRKNADACSAVSILHVCSRGVLRDVYHTGPTRGLKDGTSCVAITQYLCLAFNRIHEKSVMMVCRKYKR